MSFHLHEHVHFEEASKVHGTLCALLKLLIHYLLQVVKLDIDRCGKLFKMSATGMCPGLTAGQKTIS
eukprot:m.184879 g.184879  ORF g.184879 m.184879 type:complete len:67 (+) comp39333_c0_seq62:506-706(+)